MGPIGRWLVPLFLLVLGALLVLDGFYLSENATQNSAHAESSCTGGAPCVTPSSSCQEECGLADATGVLGGVTLVAGAWMTGVRWWRSGQPY